MAFSFSGATSGGGGFNNSVQAASGANASEGAELQEIQTDQLGFSAINGESQVRLLPKPWPSEDLPPPTSSLLSIASSKGLLAAAGHDCLIVTSTDTIRAAFRSEAKSSDEKIREIDPKIKIPQSRLTHVAFSADESVLVVSGQSGGLLAYQVEELENGKNEPTCQISTNGSSLRALLPNPVSESAHLFAAITSSGDLILVDLKIGDLRTGPSGTTLQSNVTSLAWSNRGKQFVVGLANGSAAQFKPDGTIAATIPKPPSLPDDNHVSGISWLENDLFFMIYTANDASSGIQPSEYYIVTREPKTTNFTFQKLPEVVPAFGLERVPTYHFITRLRDFPPHIQDLLILTATTGTDVGIVSKADKPLSQEDDVAGTFTFTSINDDSRRAQLPLSSTMLDTSPIGAALDLSSKEKVPNPIPSDPEILETDGPVPNFLILTNEGILVSWWLIYNDSVREKTQYSGFSHLSDSRTSTIDRKQPVAVQSDVTPKSFGNVAGAPTGTFAQQPISNSGFSSTPSTFGSPSVIGGSKPSWASTGFAANNQSQTGGSTFGQPAFGSATPMGGNTTSAFGSTSAMGNRATAIGQGATSSAPVFGQPSPFSKTPTSGFGATATASPFATASGATGAGFASFSNTNGFGGFGTKKDESTNSPFAKATGNDAFSKVASPSPFSLKPDALSGIGGAKLAESPFAGTGNFKVQSSFKSDLSSQKEENLESESSFGFGDVGKTLHTNKSSSFDMQTPLSPTLDQETEMSEGSTDTENETPGAKAEPPKPFSFGTQPPNASLSRVTPPSTLSFQKSTPAPALSSIFGASNEQNTTPVPPSTTHSWSFNGLTSTTPKETPATSQKGLFSLPSIQSGSTSQAKSLQNQNYTEIPSKKETQKTLVPEKPRIKKEDSDDEAVDLKDIPEAPLPPDPVSKPLYAPGDTSGSSNNSKTPTEDAPLPPDFVPVNKTAIAAAEREDLPSDDDEPLSSDFEESGEDITQDLSQSDEGAEDHTEQIQTSPESSFKTGERSPEISPTGGLFTKVSTTQSQKPNRPLFGEIGAGPVLPPPKTQESPRSPSPVRNLLPPGIMRSESARSVSAPAYPRSVISQRKAEYNQSAIASQSIQSKAQDAAEEKARKQAIERQRALTYAEEHNPLEDDEDELLQQELELPVSPSQVLDPYITYQPKLPETSAKSGIPAQIERLYQDINSMVYTLGINARSLSAFMQYQKESQSKSSWVESLQSETPMNVLNEEYVLGHTDKLQEGFHALESVLDQSRVDDVAGKLQGCQVLLSQGLFDLRTKLISIRKAIHAKSDSKKSLILPLSAEQASIQQDLRKTSAAVQTKLVQIEDSLAVLRAKLAEHVPTDTSSRRRSLLNRSNSQKKPTVEAVTNTIYKMTAMAEKKSADLDALEAQLKKLDLSVSRDNTRPPTSEPAFTPNTSRRAGRIVTPGSNSNSVYHTPDSTLSASSRSMRMSRTSLNERGIAILSEDKERWQAKAQHKKAVASTLRDVLSDRRKRGAVKAE